MKKGVFTVIGEGGCEGVGTPREIYFNSIQVK